MNNLSVIIAKGIENIHTKKINLRKAYNVKRHNGIEAICVIRSDHLFSKPVLLTKIKDYFKTFLTDLSSHQSKLLANADRLKGILDFVSSIFNWKHSCLKQNRKLSRVLTNALLF